LPQGRRLYNKFSLAERLGKTLAEIDALTEHEVIAWFAFFEAREENK